MEYMPVCDASGKQWGNKCLAKCDGVTDVEPCGGEPSEPSEPKPCLCT